MRLVDSFRHLLTDAPRNSPRLFVVAGMIVVLVGMGAFTFSQFRISGVENRVTKIERGNPCLEEGPDSALCQRSRNLFARTITFEQACEIVHKADPVLPCVRPRGGGLQSSPSTGSQLSRGPSAPRPRSRRTPSRLRPPPQ